MLLTVQELIDEEGTAWPVTLSMSSSGAAKRMFILEKIGRLLSHRTCRLQCTGSVAVHVLMVLQDRSSHAIGFFKS